eukprot:gene6253-4502_t
MSMKTPREYAQSSPYFKRNHLGKVACKLCNVSCSDEANFIKHLGGKKHVLALERIEAQERRQKRLVEEEKRNEEARLRVQQESAAARLLQANPMAGKRNGSSSALTGGMAALTGPHGLPQYKFLMEHNAAAFVTKVWLELYFPHAEDGSRPAHRWVSSHEQQMVRAPAGEADYYVYLLVACEGYTTAALRFPAEAMRTTEEEEAWRERDRERRRRAKLLTNSARAREQLGAGDGLTDDSQGDDTGTAPRYRSSWNALRRQYSIFFELYR